MLREGRWRYRLTFQIAGLELIDGGFKIGGRRKFRWTELDLIVGDWYSTTKTHRLIMIIMGCPKAREAKEHRPTISISRDTLYRSRQYNFYWRNIGKLIKSAFQIDAPILLMQRHLLCCLETARFAFFRIYRHPPNFSKNFISFSWFLHRWFFPIRRLSTISDNIPKKS